MGGSMSSEKKKSKTWLGWILFGVISAGGVYVGLPPTVTAPVANAVSDSVSEMVEWDD